VIILPGFNNSNIRKIRQHTANKILRKVLLLNRTSKGGINKENIVVTYAPEKRTCVLGLGL
jgi:hypothetical protein